MKLRTVPAAMALVLVVTGLSACTSKVGVAATIQGKNVTESKIGSYLTPKAESVMVQNSNQATIAVPSRSFVLQTIIEDRLFTTLIHGLPGSATTFSDSAVSAEITKELQGHTAQQVLTEQKIVGYTNAFATLWVHSAVLNNILSGLAQSGNEIENAIKALKFSVVVSPRYGTWDPKTYTLNSGDDDGYPSFLKFSATAAPLIGS